METPIFWHSTQLYLHARVPKLKDKEGKVKMVKLPWVREGSGFYASFGGNGFRVDETYTFK
ncbi:MAG: hypothetical protein Q9M97_00995 [Candidatus Gracilibacteria bacterium]|nr:hypothetical protein [Candidatus Gracilibacteria bacterium]